MPTYTIVSADKTPLGPNEIASGQNISVSDGDVFIFAADAAHDVTFVNDGAIPASFDIVINDSNPSNAKIVIDNDLQPNLTIADNVDIGLMDIDASNSDGLDMTAGDNVTLGKLQGSNSADDVITLGNGFTATGDWDLHDGNDAITVGDDATFVNVKLGKGDDSIVAGDNLSFNEIDGEDGQDDFWVGDNANGSKLKGGSGDDTMRTGLNEQISTVDGEAGTDTYYSRTAGTSPRNMEGTMVCFAAGTPIRTAAGPRPVEMLRPGLAVWTRDHGLQTLRWVGAFDVTAEDPDPCKRPVRIRAGALGPGCPGTDLLVSQNHRILLRSSVVARMFGVPEVLAPAKKLTHADGIDIVSSRGAMRYVHLAFDRHEVLWAAGAETESMLLAPMALGTLTPAQRAQLRLALRTDRDPGAGAEPARPLVERASALRNLVERSRANGKALQDSAQSGQAAA